MYSRLPATTLLIVCVGWPHTRGLADGSESDADTKPTSCWFACSSVSAVLPSFTGIVRGGCCSGRHTETHCRVFKHCRLIFIVLRLAVKVEYVACP
jgi:hypothetical protein